MKFVSPLSSRHNNRNQEKAKLESIENTSVNPTLMEIHLYSGGQRIGNWLADPEKVFYHTNSSTVEFLDAESGQCFVISGTFIIRSRITAKDLSQNNNSGK